MKKHTKARSKSSDNWKTPFDIICGDYLQSLSKEDAPPETHLKRITFTHYYRSFTREMQEHPHGYPVLMKALRSAVQHYVLTPRPEDAPQRE